MKIISSFFLFAMINSTISAKEIYFTGSTPAGAIVKTFLGIPLSDSIDFIRWKLAITERTYKLHCNYGIGKPNTNGFYNGGKIIEITGTARREGTIYLLFNNNKTLKAAELNKDLLHFLDADDSPLKGNGGWSYTINNLSPSHSDEISLSSKHVLLKDSMAFEGRSPCDVPGIDKGDQCYKLKWYIVFYADIQKSRPTTFRILGTAWRKQGNISGTWKIIIGKDGRIIYRLNDEEGKTLFNLLKVHEKILLFTDINGKLLVGDLDFSYTLNKKF